MTICFRWTRWCGATTFLIELAHAIPTDIEIFYYGRNKRATMLFKQHVPRARRPSRGVYCTSKTVVLIDTCIGQVLPYDLAGFKKVKYIICLAVKRTISFDLIDEQKYADELSLICDKTVSFAIHPNSPSWNRFNNTHVLYPVEFNRDAFQWLLVNKRLKLCSKDVQYLIVEAIAEIYKNK